MKSPDALKMPVIQPILELDDTTPLAYSRAVSGLTIGSSGERENRRAAVAAPP